MYITETIAKFLNLHTRPDLAKLYNEGMEVQINVRPDGGQPLEGGKRYTNGLYDWFNVRIPKNAMAEPEYEPWVLKWPLQEHALAIGMTGWNFMQRRSMHLGYDFDAICGNAHAATGVSAEELERVKAAACAIPWVEVRRSTGGSGLHLRVHLGLGVPTANHTEHAALGRAILGMMSAAAGFNFESSIDVCGGNMWVWHRKMTEENQGLTLIKQGLSLDNVPDNWRDHIDVVSGRRRRTRVEGLPDSVQDKLAELSEATKTVALDENHRKLMDWLVDHRWTCSWESDHGMMRTHTAGLAEAHEALELQGVYTTLARGRESGDINCYAYPRPGGGWRVVRYGEGTLESDTWVQDRNNWTYCYFNQKPDLRSAAMAKGGVADTDGGFVLPSMKVAAEVAAMLGARLDVNDLLANRQTKLKAVRDGEGLSVEVKKNKDDEAEAKVGFIEKKGTLTRVIAAALPKPESEATSYDEKIRYLTSKARDGGGWLLNIHEQWHTQPKDNIVSVLMNSGMDGATAKAVCGQIVEDAWTFENIPFQQEYPGGRRWNRDAAQLRYKPDGDATKLHPHWDMIFQHCGQGLSPYMEKNNWCKTNGILDGATYLRYWMASMFQYPYEPLPYLFFYSEPYQNCGKSTFYEAATLLMTKGVVKADNALRSAGNFNGELLGAILCAIEETDLSKQGGVVYERVKDYVTGRMINIHSKGMTPFMVPNTTHWVQCANLQRACPIFEGDTRVTMIQVYPFKQGQEIPWPRLREKLQEEAPAFLRTVFDINIPVSDGRLRLPPVETDDKLRAMEFTRDELQAFLAAECTYAPGLKMDFATFYSAFTETLGASEKIRWTKNRVMQSLPPRHPYGDIGSRVMIGNIGLGTFEVDGTVEPIIRAGNKLCQNGKFLTE